MEAQLSSPSGKGKLIDSLDRVYMSTEKSYFALLSIIYNFQSYKLKSVKGLNSPMESESDNLEGYSLNGEQLKVRVNKDKIEDIGKTELIILMS